MDPIKAKDGLLISQLQSSAIGRTKPQDAEGAARQFEGMLLQEMFKSMWQGVPNGGLLSGSSEEATYRDMLNEAVAKSVSEGRGIGVREVIERDINKLQSAKKDGEK